jgi:hypothetical protein
MANMHDINQPAGWLARVVTPGEKPITRHYKAYVLDKDDAVEAVRKFAGLDDNETCEAITQLNTHEFTGSNMSPGDVKQHDG